MSARVGRQGGTRVRAHGRLVPYAFLMPAVVILCVFFLGAFAQVVYFSFTRYSAFGEPEWVGLENYRRLLGSERFWWCLLNSGLYLLVTPAVMAVALVAALVVDSASRGSTLLRLLLFLPVVTPTVVAAVAWRLIFNEDAGLLNRGLTAVGLGTVPWLTQWPWTLISPMIVTLWKGFGFYMMVFAAGLMAVPKELKEAAGLDGAGRWGVFRHVTLPALAPVLALVFIVSSISALKVFDEIYVTAKGAPITHQTGVPLVYQTAFGEGEFGMASAIGLALFAVILVLSLVNLRLSLRRESGGGR